MMKIKSPPIYADWQALTNVLGGTFNIIYADRTSTNLGFWAALVNGGGFVEATFPSKPSTWNADYPSAVGLSEPPHLS
jgi:hypothetical protein